LISLHDWQLHSIMFDWNSGELRLDLSWESERHELVAIELGKLNLPHEFPWGPSNWINEMDGPSEIADGLFELKIEMQPGDMIEIVAKKFKLPPDKPMPAAGQLPLG
jgi:hypothetical protein